MTMRDPDAKEVRDTIALIQGLVALVLGALLLWIGSELVAIGKTNAELKTLYGNLNEAILSRERIAALEREQIRVTAHNKLEALQANVARLDALLTQIWPRLRAHGENIEKLHAVLKTKFNDIDLVLVKPEKY